MTSAETLRQVLKLMTAHASDYRPQTYAVWHEYVIGRNAALSARLQGPVERGERIPAAVSDEIYLHAVSESRERVLSITHAHMQSLLDGIAAAAGDVAHETGNLTRSLAAFDPAVLEHQNRQFVEQSIALLAEAACQSRVELERVQSRLRDSEQAVQRMGEELAAVREEAHVDPLTGLANRRRLDKTLIALAGEAANGGTPLTLLMIDIDHFKQLNDRHGHHFGDQVIQCISQAIRSSIKGRDLAARFGGDEFAIILPETPIEGGVTVGNFIRRIVERARNVDFATNDLVTGITLSIGVATLRDGEAPEQLTRRADTALYDSKRHGRNRVTCAA
ncbi:MAG: diguanylate cyclase [Lautropia sp.]